jgi:HK97 family phage major capsid protein
MEVVNAALDERRAELQKLKDEQVLLRSEWADKRFDAPTKQRFLELERDIRELEDLIREKEKVNSLVERHVREGTGLEDGVAFHTRRPGVVTGEDIWDLSTIERAWDDPSVEARQIHDRTLRAIERTKIPHPRASQEDGQNRLERMIGDEEGGSRKGSLVAEYILTTGSPMYRSAFMRYLNNAPLSERDQSVLYRAMSLTAASGGYAVPFVLDTALLPTSNGAVNPYRQIASVSTVTVDEWRGVTSGGITAAFQAEAAETTDNSPTLAQPTVSTEMGRALVPYSIEIGMDWGDFASSMAADLQDAKDVLEATKFAVGSGTNEPAGIITGASGSVYTASATNVLIVADIYGWHDALPPRFRNGATITLNNAVLSKIRQLDTAGGSAMLTPNLQVRSAANVADMTDGRANVDIFGKAVWEASGQSGTFTTGQLIGVIGDYGRYFKIIDRIGLTVETIPHLTGTTANFPSGQRGLFAYWRTGSKILSSAAFRVLKLA